MNKKNRKPLLSGRGGNYLRNQIFSAAAFLVVMLLLIGFVESGMYDRVMQWFP